MSDAYIDGFVFPIPTDNLERYREIATAAGKLWLEHGALAYWESIGDDLAVQEQADFHDLAATGPDETVGFSWIVFRSREHRDEVNALVMADPRMEALHDPDNPVFDHKRMAYGGFKTLVQLMGRQK